MLDKSPIKQSNLCMTAFFVLATLMVVWWLHLRSQSLRRAVLLYHSGDTLWLSCTKHVQIQRLGITSWSSTTSRRSERLSGYPFFNVFHGWFFSPRYFWDVYVPSRVLKAEKWHGHERTDRWETTWSRNVVDDVVKFHFSVVFRGLKR